MTVDLESIRLVATDLDGTLLNREGVVSARTRAMIATAQRAGVRVAYITGRPFVDTHALMSGLGLDGFIAASNGAILWDGQVLAQCALEGTRVTRIITTLRRSIPGVQLGAVTCDLLGLDADFPADLSAMWNHQGGFFTMNDIANVGGVLKIIAAHKDLRVGALAQQTRLCLDAGYEVTYSTHRFIEISDANANKGAAVEAAAAWAQVPLSAVACVGDMPNDLPMMSRAGLSVAVANADPMVLAAADLVVASNEDDGVAELLEGVVRSRLMATGA